MVGCRTSPPTTRSNFAPPNARTWSFIFVCSRLRSGASEGMSEGMSAGFGTINSLNLHGNDFFSLCCYDALEPPRSRCSTCKRRFPSPTARKTCSHCLLKQRSKAKIRRERAELGEKPSMYTKYCSSCKRHLDEHEFEFEYKTCENCRSRKALARAAVREISLTHCAVVNVLLDL